MNYIQEKVEDIIKKTENNFVFNRSNFNAERLTFYIFVDGSTKKGNCKEIEILKDYIKSVFNRENAVYLHISGDGESGLKEVETFFQSWDFVGQQQLFDTASSLAIVPVFIQNDKFGKALEEYREFYSNIEKKLYDIPNLSIIWQPVAIIKAKDKHSQDEFMEKILTWREISNTHLGILPVMILYKYDASNFDIDITNIIQTLCFTTVVSTKPDSKSSIFHYAGTSNCFSARSVTIKLPFHVGILENALDLLDFFLEEPSDKEAAVKNLGKSFSELPNENGGCWRFWNQLPLKDNHTISLAPVYSILYPLNCSSEKKEKIFFDFADTYYLSKIPVTVPDRSLVDGFYEKYVKGYGNYITGFENLFANPDNFINQYIQEIPICENTIDNIDDKDIKGFVNQLSESVRNRVKEFYKNLLSEDCEWYSIAKKRFSDIRNEMETLRTTLINEIRHWRGIEGSIPFKTPIGWNSEQRKELMTAYIEILKSGDDEVTEKVCNFCEVLLKIARSKVPNSVDYIEKFEGEYRIQKVQNKSFEDWKKLLGCQTFSIVPLNNGSEEYHCIYNREKELTFIAKIVDETDEEGKIYYSVQINDRVEILHFSKPGNWRFDKDINGGVGNESS